MGRTMNKLTKLVLSFLMVITCVNISSIRAEDGDDENYVESNVVETMPETSEDQTQVADQQDNENETTEETKTVEESETPEETAEAAVETMQEATTEPTEATESTPETPTEETVVENQDNSTEKTVNEMSSDELFNYVMSLNAEELDALYDVYPNLDELMANFTADQQAQLADKFGNAEEDIEALDAIAAANEANASTVTVSAKNDDGETNSLTFDGGTINSTTAPSWSGNTYKKAYVLKGGVQYSIQYLTTYKGSTYYAEDADPDACQKLADGETVVFEYEKNVTKYTITYTESGKDGQDDNNYEGATSVKEGEDLHFKVNVAQGYSVVVTANETKLSGTEENAGLTYSYTISSVNADQAISITYSKTAKFTVDASIKSSFEENAHNATISPETQTVNNGGEASWTITGATVSRNEYIWCLNSLNINGEDIVLPTSFTKGATATTTLQNGKNKGMVVTVTLTSINSSRGTTTYTHTVTVSNIKTDVSVDFMNLRSSTWSEVMPIKIDGVTVEGYYSNDWNEVLAATPIGYNSFADNQMQFRFKLNKGYGNPVVEVNGKTVTVSGPNTQGYYTFTTNKVSGSGVVSELSVSASKIDYTVSYDLNGGEGTITDSSKYNVRDGGSSTILVSSKVPTKTGTDGKTYYFQGWSFNGSTYLPGSKIELGDLDTIPASEDNVITLT